MSRNIAEIYLDNPSTTLGNNDLLYSGISPYGTNNDSAIKYGDLFTQISSGGQIRSVTNLTSASYTLLSTDYIIAVNFSGTVSIGLIASPVIGRSYRIKDISGGAASNNITVTPASGNIDGAANLVINTNYGSIDVVYTGSQWSVL